MDGSLMVITTVSSGTCFLIKPTLWCGLTCHWRRSSFGLLEDRRADGFWVSRCGTAIAKPFAGCFGAKMPFLPGQYEHTFHNGDNGQCFLVPKSV
jgi:hypothetical protein